MYGSKPWNPLLTFYLAKPAWYHKSNLFLYLWRMAKELALFKVPEVVKRLTLKAGAQSKALYNDKLRDDS